MGASYREWESRCQSPDRVITLIHEEHTIETYAHFSSPSELTALAFHNTIIIVTWKEAIITNLNVGFNHTNSNTSIRLLISQVV
jgi:hypothetical protein